MKVSACIITYNQENFINDCIEGALNQIVDFDYEIIIGDDCSTDKTSEICKNYAQNYPNIIKYYRRDQNLGLSGNWIATLKNCSGNYVALCEGDDYWTNPNKLQLQVDDICNDDSCMFSFHDSVTMNAVDHTSENRVGNKKIDTKPDFSSVIKQNNIRTETIVFKNIINWDELPIWFHNTLKIDFAIILLLLKNGYAKFFSKSMSVYRIHNNSLWSSKETLHHYNEDMKFFKNIYNYENNIKRKKTINERINFIQANHGIYLIRNGNLTEGLLFVLTNNNWLGDKRLRIYFRKILSALKTGLFLKINKPN